MRAMSCAWKKPRLAVSQRLLGFCLLILAAFEIGDHLVHAPLEGAELIAAGRGQKGLQVAFADPVRRSRQIG